MFHVIEKEICWRKEHGRPEGFESLKKSKPVIAVGADEPLGGELLEAAYYHTLLSSISTAETDSTSISSPLFTPSSSPSHLEVLEILDREPPDTITLIAIGPLTTFATAAAHSPTTFLKAKSLIVMGGAINFPGNMTPVAEFNTIADPVAAARIYALTSPDPESTMPPFGSATGLKDYPPKDQLGDRRLRVAKFPLDITTRHSLRRDEAQRKVNPLREMGSPLAEWVMAFTEHGFQTTESLDTGHEVGGGSTWISLHDPVVVWYAVATGGEEMQGWEIVKGEDIRVETVGQWTRGMCVVDRRDRKKGKEGEGEVKGDMGDWLSWNKGNRVDRCVRTPGDRVLAGVLLETIFGK
ncbi:MAG: hypothetical protein Q9221_003827 [Calogaya cf. arnoldii]